ncbi:MAG: hypothetical protein ACOCW2_02340, partial [Chitinivibrionales bacterium]
MNVNTARYLFLIVLMVACFSRSVPAQNPKLHIISLNGIEQGDTVRAGDTLSFRIQIEHDSILNLEENRYDTSWSVLIQGGRATWEDSSGFHFISTLSGQFATIIAELNVPIGISENVKDSFTVFIDHTEMDFVAIERAGYPEYGNVISPRILLPGDSTYSYHVMMYDRFDNPIGPAHSVIWGMDTSGVVEYSVDDTGTITISTTGADGTVVIYASDTSSGLQLRDSLELYVPSEWFPRIAF